MKRLAIGIVVLLSLAGCGDDTTTASDTTDVIASVTEAATTSVAPSSSQAGATTVQATVAATTSVAPSSSQAGATTVQATVAATRCVAFPTDTAESLITNSDTGKRKIDGEIKAAAAVLSKENTASDSPIVAQRDKPLYFVSISVGGKIVTLAHSVIDGSGKPDGQGLWYAVDQVSDTATGFPYAPDTPAGKTLRTSLDTDGAKESRACVLT